MKTLLTVAVSLGLLCTAGLGCKKQNNETADASQAQGVSLFSRSYPINSATFAANLRRVAAPKGRESNQDMMVRFFKENGITVDPPAAVLLDEGGNRLLVRAPESEKEKVQALFERIQKGQ